MAERFSRKDEKAAQGRAREPTTSSHSPPGVLRLWRFHRVRVSHANLRRCGHFPGVFRRFRRTTRANDGQAFIVPGERGACSVLFAVRERGAAQTATGDSDGWKKGARTQRLPMRSSRKVFARSETAGAQPSTQVVQYVIKEKEAVRGNEAVRSCVLLFCLGGEG